ncbi:hypothetical protein [Streptococcus hyointestinalis]|uniref:hypothetical protein n=1 Tax=Streptococcus hyointestinalis TaxID=1337 RepID=UPI0013DFC0B2|nr:hypothetical protein [Streptococcus hyointestinalis]
MMTTVLKWFVLLVLAAIVGTFFCNVFEGLVANNVWLARGIGCLVAGLTGAVFYHYVIQTSKS